jgi:hypothetical protein
MQWWLDFYRSVSSDFICGDRELDVLMLGTIFPQHCAVTAKKSLKRIPFLGWFSAYILSDVPAPNRNKIPEGKLIASYSQWH